VVQTSKYHGSTILVLDCYGLVTSASTTLLHGWSTMPEWPLRYGYSLRPGKSRPSIFYVLFLLQITTEISPKIYQI